MLGKDEVLLHETGMKKARAKVNFFVATAQKLKTYGVWQ
jgi:hypothetical protein